MRPILIGISLLAIISGLAPTAAAEVIENQWLSFPSVPWEFSTRTNTFYGQADGGRDDELVHIGGQMELRAKFDDEGLFLLAEVAVPAPAPGVLLGVGMVILLAVRMRRLA